MCDEAERRLFNVNERDLSSPHGRHPHGLSPGNQKVAVMLVRITMSAFAILSIKHVH